MNSGFVLKGALAQLKPIEMHDALHDAAAAQRLQTQSCQEPHPAVVVASDLAVRKPDELAACVVNISSATSWINT